MAERDYPYYSDTPHTQLTHNSHTTRRPRADKKAMRERAHNHFSIVRVGLRRSAKRDKGRRIGVALSAHGYGTVNARLWEALIHTHTEHNHTCGELELSFTVLGWALFGCRRHQRTRTARHASSRASARRDRRIERTVMRRSRAAPRCRRCCRACMRA
jgi:hypothetical protein